MLWKHLQRITALLLKSPILPFSPRQCADLQIYGPSAEFEQDAAVSILAEIYSWFRLETGPFSFF